MHRNRIRNRSRRVWTCTRCGVWHYDEKPSLCQACSGISFLYFASKAEAKRYASLKMMEKAGKISHLKTQVKFPFIHNGHTICSYVADFTYKKMSGEDVVEDVKGFRDEVYSLKKKMMAAYYGIEINEVKA